MGALRQPRPSEPTRKPPAKATVEPEQSLSERLRAQTNYENDSGYAPAYHAAVIDLARLSSGHVCDMFVLMVNALSYGRPRDGKAARPTSTLPISAEELADLTRCGLREIQRQLVDLPERGMISVKVVKNGTTRYVISLLYSKWAELEDYAVWKRRQVVVIDDADTDADTDDAEAVPISKDAVHLFKKPASVRPGRATKAAKINVGVREIVCQNDSPTVDTVFSAVVQSGRLVVSSTSQAVAQKGEREAKEEDKANAGRHGCRELPANEGRVSTGLKLHPRVDEIISVFDPILQHYGSFPLLKFDPKGVERACAELGAMPLEALQAYAQNTRGRCGRNVSTSAVPGIVKDARLHWLQGTKERNKVRRADIARFEAVLKNPRESEIDQLDRLRELIAECQAEMEPES